jgi:hypothetical protein
VEEAGVVLVPQIHLGGAGGAGGFADGVGAAAAAVLEAVGDGGLVLFLEQAGVLVGPAVLPPAVPSGPAGFRHLPSPPSMVGEDAGTRKTEEVRRCDARSARRS